MTSDFQSTQAADILVTNLIELSSHTHSNSAGPAIWITLEKTLAQKFGYALFTILTFSPSRGVTRIHSTDVGLQPLGPRTPGTGNNNDSSDNSDSLPPFRNTWIQQVLVNGKTWRGSTQEDLKMVFEDWELLWHAGLGSVLNIPVRLNDQTIGSLNILDKEHAYDVADLEIGILIAQIVAFYIHKVGEGTIT